MSSSKIKVLYIAGCGRSGSTILANILGQIEGFFSVGELRNAWDRCLIENRPCGCGVAFQECSVWKGVLTEAFGSIDRIDIAEMVRLFEGNTSTRSIPTLLLPGGKQLLATRLKKYLNNLESLYGAIRSQQGCKVIIDSSKYVSYGSLLEMISVLELYIVHLVRDSRAVAYSWLREKVQPDPRQPIYMPRYSSAGSSLRWTLENVAAEILWRGAPGRYLFLRYEDFVDKPQEVLRKILDLVQEEGEIPSLAERTVELGVNHNVWGNPNRFATGTIKLKRDEEWKAKMRRSDKVSVTAVTWPLLLRYGYLSDISLGDSRS